MLRYLQSQASVPSRDLWQPGDTAESLRADADWYVATQLLIGEAYLPPAVSAAILTAMGKLMGAVSHKNVIERTTQSTRETIIFNPQTAALLEYRVKETGKPEVREQRLRTAILDKPRQLPRG